MPGGGGGGAIIPPSCPPPLELLPGTRLVGSPADTATRCKLPPPPPPCPQSTAADHAPAAAIVGPPVAPVFAKHAGLPLGTPADFKPPPPKQLLGKKKKQD